MVGAQTLVWLLEPLQAAAAGTLFDMSPQLGTSEDSDTASLMSTKP